MLRCNMSRLVPLSANPVAYIPVVPSVVYHYRSCKLYVNSARLSELALLVDCFACFNRDLQLQLV